LSLRWRESDTFVAAKSELRWERKPGANDLLGRNPEAWVGTAS
jgi:hypothetical protein